MSAHPGTPDQLTALSSMHEEPTSNVDYTAAHASVRFMGESLDPLDVTKALRLPYDHAHRNGEPNLGRRRGDGSVHEYAAYRQGMWSMSSKGWVTSVELEHHVLWLLEQLESRAAVVRGLIGAGVAADIFCFCAGLVSSPPELSPDTVARARALGLIIDIDYYGPSEEP